jgi:hemerythrin-like domain-containing protein
MMTETQGSDLPVTLVLIHRVLTRGLDVGLRYTEEFTREGYPDPATGAGLALYLQMLAGALYLHHSAEDQIGFPLLREKLPDVPVDRLTAEHEQMAAILEELAPILDRMRGEAEEGPLLEAARAELVKLAQIWPAHIRIEETNISVKKLVALIGPDALAEWLQQMGQHRPEGSPPDPVVVPFILHNLSAEDRATMAQYMPPVVSQELVPVVWKEHWAPMKPFLLD